MVHHLPEVNKGLRGDVEARLVNVGLGHGEQGLEAGSVHDRTA
jgi:hypothetical protein